MFVWAHVFEDSIEGITHSICRLEFENHRPLYDWFITAVNQGRAEDDLIVVRGKGNKPDVVKALEADDKKQPAPP